jgi:hypothetical protein
MSKRIFVVGLTAICTLAVSGFTASGAFAEGYTAYTCIAGEGNTNGDCTPGSEYGGNYGHVAIPTGETTETTLKATSNQVLRAELFGAEVIFTAKKLEAIGTHIHNNTGGEEMDVNGGDGITIGAGLLYSEVSVNIPGCTADEPTFSKPENKVTTEPLYITTTNVGDVELSPLLGNVFAVVHLTNVPGKSCPASGEYKVEGISVTATVSGATLSVATAEGELTIGEEKEPAFLTGSATVTAGLTGGEQYAIALTTS